MSKLTSTELREIIHRQFLTAMNNTQACGCNGCKEAMEDEAIQQTNEAMAQIKDHVDYVIGANSIPKADAMQGGERYQKCMTCHGDYGYCDCEKLNRLRAEQRNRAGGY